MASKKRIENGEAAAAESIGGGNEGENSGISAAYSSGKAHGGENRRKLCYNGESVSLKIEKLMVCRREDAGSVKNRRRESGRK